MVGFTSWMPRATVIAGSCLMVAAATVPQPTNRMQAGIQATLDASAAAWSAGDLDRFMTCYDNADGTVYVNSTRFVQGYAAIRAMYAERFGGGVQAKMGKLSVQILKLRAIDRDNAFIVGRFELHRDKADGGDATGITTLLFRRTAAGWRIVSDHS